MRRMTGQLLLILYSFLFLLLSPADLNFGGGISGVIDLYWHADVLKR